MGEVGVELGFFEEAEAEEGWSEECMHEDGNWKRWAEGRAGGAPVWLYPFDSSKLSSCVTCKGCSEPMSFFLQIYAPLDGKEFAQAFHRTLYVFICRQRRNQVCNESAVVLRGQLARENAWYASDIVDEDQQVDCLFDRATCIPSLSLGPPFVTRTIVTEAEPQAGSGKCGYCERPANNKCAGCKCVYYCCKEHQKAHWASHKQLCKLLRKEIEKIENGILEEDEDQPDEQQMGDMDKDSSDVDPQGQGQESVSDADFSQDDIINMIASGNEAIKAKLKTDPSFESFQVRVSRDVEQCIRYSRWPSNQAHTPEKVDENENDQETTLGEIWLSTKHRCTDPSPCELCGAPRRFEFQIMPQSLFYLMDTEVDFGTIAVYTCTKSCSVPVGEYAKEFLHFQQAHYS